MQLSTFQELQLDLKNDLRVLVRRMEHVRRGIANFIDADFVYNSTDANKETVTALHDNGNALSLLGNAVDETASSSSHDDDQIDSSWEPSERPIDRRQPSHRYLLHIKENVR